MNNPRANIGHILAAAGGGLLVIFLFVAWYGGGGESASAFKFFSVIDLALFVIGVASAAFGAAHLTGAAANFPWLKPSILKYLGIVATTLTLSFVIELTVGRFGPVEMKFGAVIAVLASIAILVGGILNERPDLAARLNAATSNLGAPAAAGTPAPGPAQAAPTPAAQPAPAATPAPTPTPQPEPTPAPTPAAAPTPTPAPAAESAGPAAGWYPDPQGQKRLRYWDGQRWTDQTAD